MSLTTTAERITQAAASCPEAAQVLKRLFPEVFAVQASEDRVNVKRLRERSLWWGTIIHEDSSDGDRRFFETFREEGILISTNFSWTLKQVDGFAVLVPRKNDGGPYFTFESDILSLLKREAHA